MLKLLDRNGHTIYYGDWPFIEEKPEYFRIDGVWYKFYDRVFDYVIDRWELVITVTELTDGNRR